MKNYKLKIKKAVVGRALLRRPISAGIFILHFAFCIFNCSATPFYLQGYRSDNPALTNQIGVSFFPPSQSPFEVYGTNIIYGGNIVTITPNSSGYSSNWLYAGTYEFYFTNLNAAFVAVIPDTTNFNSLALYVTNVTGFSGTGLNSYGVVTNLLTFPPATNTLAGILALLGYTPATNSNAGITAAQGFASATNSLAGVLALLGYTPATNSNAGITAAQGFASATNSNAGITAAQGFASATNSTAGIKAALGYTPQTNFVGASSVASLATNSFIVWIAYQTNGVPGSAYTNLPQGSLMTTTNGAFFVLSNLVWNPK